MSDDPAAAGTAGVDRSSIALFFDRISSTRNALFQAHPGLGILRMAAMLAGLGLRQSRVRWPKA